MESQLYERALEIAKRNGEHRLEIEGERYRIMREFQDAQMDLLDRKLEFGQLRMSSAHHILDTWSQDSSFEEFRQRCRHLIKLFGKFVKLYNEDLAAKDLKKPPTKLIEASGSLLDFSEAVQLLYVAYNLPFDYSILQTRIMQKCHSIQTRMNQILSKIGKYQKRSLWKRMFKSRPSFDDYYDSLKHLVEQLKDLVKYLSLPASQQFDQTLLEQFRLLSTDILQDHL